VGNEEKPNFNLLLVGKKTNKLSIAFFDVVHLNEESTRFGHVCSKLFILGSLSFSL